MFDIILYEPEIPPNTGNIMRMIVDLQAGGTLCPQGVLLAPNTPYREYVYNVNHNTVGYADFVTSAAGTFRF